MFKAMEVFILCFLGITLLAQVQAASVRNYRFEVMKSSHSRLCTNKTMLTVNGQFPGPTIYARRGDLVIVDVINQADQNITIHWHGVKMPRYPWGDGTGFITQCPITPGGRFRQQMILSDEEGTLWWHAHIDWTRATIHGAIVVLPPKGETYRFPKPHAQVPILLGEWWNGDVQEIMENFFATGHDGQVCDAFLINGQPGDLFPCSRKDAIKLRVEVGKTYLIRMVNAMLNYVSHFRISGHNVTVVGTDGAYTKPLSTDYVAIAPGQTMDFLLQANQPPGRYYMAAKVFARGTDYSPATGIIEYAGSPPSLPPPQLPYFPQFTVWTESSDLTNQYSNRIRSLASDEHPSHVPKDITQSLFFVLAMNLWPCTESTCGGPERVLASVNNVSMLLPRAVDILDAYYRGIGGVYTADFPDQPPSTFNYVRGEKARNESLPERKTSVMFLEYNETVEIVFQGTNHADGFDHPMHLHGHNFYVVGSGFGNFDPARDPLGYNLVDPPLVETTVVPINGWATIRFKANNPGVWFMHCHFDRHQSWGMKLAFIVKDGKAPNEKMLPPPPDLPRCGGEPSSSVPFLLAEWGKISNGHGSMI